jgi:hypothetical protein
MMGAAIRRVARARYAYWFFVALLGLIVFLWRPRLAMPRSGLDPSWSWAMNEIVARKIALGRDAIFTFGPLSRVYSSQYHPDLFVSHCLVAAGLAALYVALLHRLASAAFSNLAARIAVMFALSLIASAADVFWYALAPLGLLAVLAQRREQDERVEALLWLGLSSLTLIKSSFAISTGLLWMTEVVRCALARKVRWPLLLFPLGGVAFWIAEGQSVLDLPLFVRNTLDIFVGYPVAMSHPVRSPYLPVTFWLIIGPAAPLLFLSLRKRQTLGSALAVVLGFLFLGWSLFKAGFVAEYSETGIMGAAFMAACVWLACFRDFPGRRARALIASSMAVTVGIVSWMSSLFYSQNVASYLVDRARDTASLARLNFEDLRGGGLRSGYYAAISRIRSRLRMPKIKGTVDVYRTNLAVAFANNLDWNPRLAIQSYAAFTPYLIEKNRQHLLGPDSPDAVIVELSTVSKRYPMLDDGASLLEILARYELVARPKGMALLTRRSRPNPYRFERPQSLAARFGEPLALPSMEGKLLWAQIEFANTISGRIMGMAFRPPMMSMGVVLGNGKRRNFRMAPNMSAGGFLLSPFVEDVNTYLTLSDAKSRPASPDTQVASIEFHVEPGYEWMLARRISVQLSEVEFSQDEAVEEPPPAPRRHKARKRRIRRKH